MKSTALADERGESLVETLVAVAIIAIVLTTFLVALSTATWGVATVRERVTAVNLARAQLEHVQETNFIADTDHYTPTAISHSGYDATISAATIYTGVQQITVTIYHNGPVFTIGNYKVKR